MPDLHWFCAACQEPAIQAVHTDKIVEDRCKYYMSKMEEELTDIKEKLSQKADKKEVSKLQQQLKTRASMQQMQTISDEIARLETTINEVKQMEGDIIKNRESGPEERPQGAADASPKRKNTIQLSISEIEDRERRKCNLVMFGLKEGEEGTDQVSDKSRAEKLCRDLGEIVEVKKSYRLGEKNPNGPRPLKETLLDETTRNKVLKKAKELRNLGEDNKKIFLKKDLTPLEREEDKKLREERDSKRDENQKKGVTETTWVIRRGRVIKVRTRDAADTALDPQQDQSLDPQQDQPVPPEI